MKSYLKEINFLRALAVVSVIVYHVSPSLLPNGLLGVDIFFVISGFLISNIVISELQNGTFSLFDFYVKRALRILPLLYFILISTLCFIFLYPESMAVSIVTSVLSNLFFISNIYFWKFVNYFTASALYNPLIHTWSLSVEIQFYLLVPFIFLLAYKLNKLKQLIFIISASSFFIFVYLINKSISFSFYMLPTRLFEFGLGAVAALLPAYIKKVNIFFYHGVILTLISFLVFDFFSMYAPPNFSNIFVSIFCALFLYFLRCQDTSQNSFYAFPLFQYTGKISYSLYLNHQFIFSILSVVFFRQLNFFSGLEIFLIFLFLLLVSSFTYHFIELPFRFYFPRRVSFLFLIVSFLSIVFFSVYYLISANNGSLFTRVEGGNKYSVTDVFKGYNNVFFYGDSHAQLLQKNFEGHVDLTASSCPIFSSIDSRYQTSSYMNLCMKNKNYFFSFIENADEKDLFIISSRYVFYLDPSPIKTIVSVEFHKKFNFTNTDNLVSNDVFVEFFNRLNASRARFIIIDPIPELGFDPNLFLHNSNYFFDTDINHIVTNNFYSSRYKSYLYAKELFVGSDNIVFFPTAHYFCNTYCFVEREGSLLYSDSNHLSDSGYALLLNALLGYIR